MPITRERHLDDPDQARIYREVASQLAEVIDAARTVLFDAFCPDGAFELDTDGEVIASVNAERVIDRAFDELEIFQLELHRKGAR
jgi:hypothetical protein